MNTSTTTTAHSCPACNTPHAATDRYCKACGTALLPPPSCPACHAEVPREARFCPACGVRVVGARPDATPTAPLADTPPAPPPAPTVATPTTPVDARALVADMRQLKPSRSSSIVANVLVFVAVLLVFLVFTRAWNAGKPKEGSMFGGAPPAAGLSQPEPGTAAPSTDVRPIRGAVTLAAGVEAGRGTLFVVVRNAGGGERGPPLAVQRFEAPSFPVEFEVGPAQVMMPGMPFTGPFDVTARLDSDGNAMTRDPADLVSPPVRGVTVGQEGLALVLGGAVEAPASAAPASAAPASAAPASAAPAVSPAVSPAPAPVTPSPRAAGPAGRVTGRVVAGPDVSPVGAGSLYVMLRAAGSPEKGPPLAVRKYDAAAIPLTFDLGPEHVMLQGMPFQGPFDVYARVDRDGDAATRTPGDLEVTRPIGGVALGGVSADVVLDRRR